MFLFLVFLDYPYSLRPMPSGSRAEDPDGTEILKSAELIQHSAQRGFYNRQRLHSSLGYQSPQTFTENYYKKAG